MGVQLVSDLYDIPALQAQHDQFISFLKDSKEAIIDLNNQRVTAKGSSLSEFTNSTDELNRAIAQSTTSTQRATAAKKELTKAEVEARVATQQRTAALKEEVINSQAAKGSYDQLNSQLKTLIKQYKAMGDEERNSTAGRTLQKDILEKNAQLKIFDADLGNYQRNVGNYNSSLGRLSKGIKGLGGLGVILSRALGIDPEIAMSVREVGRAIRDVQHARELQEVGLSGEAELYEQSKKKLDAFAASAEATTGATVEDTTAQTANTSVKTEAVAATEELKVAETQLAETKTEAVVATNLELSAEERLEALRVTIGATVDKRIAEELALSDAKFLQTTALTQNTVAENVNSVSAQRLAVAEAELAVATKAASTGMSLFGKALLFSGIAAVLVGIGYVIYQMHLASKAAEEAARSQKLYNDILEESKSEYVKAVTEVDNLKVAFQQAKDGVITKGEALKLYNETIGKTTGQVKTLDEAEKALGKNADAYVQFTLYKAAANVALGKSAEKAFEIEKNRMETDKPEADFLQKLEDQQKLAKAARQGEDVYAETLKQIQNERAQRAKETARQKEIDNQNDEAEFDKIGAGFRAKAQALASKYKFDFNGIKEDTAKKGKEDNYLEESLKRTVEYNKKALDELAKYSEQELKALQDKYKKIYSDQDNSQNERLQALQNFYDASRALSIKEGSRLIEQNNLSAKIESDKENEAFNKSKKTQAEKDQLANALNAIEKQRVATEQNIIATSHKELEIEAQDFATETLKINKESNAKDEKLMEDHVKALKEIHDNSLKESETKIDNTANAASLKLQQDYEIKIDKATGKQKIKLEEELQAKLKAIAQQAELDKLQLRQQDLQNTRDDMEALGLDTTNIEAAITENLRQQLKIRAELHKDNNATIEKDAKERRDAAYGYAVDGLDALQSIEDAGFENEKNRIQDQIDLKDAQLQKDIEAENASTDSAADKANKITVIEARAAAEKEALQKKQKKADYDKAVFDKEIEILKTVGLIAVDIADGNWVAAAAAGAALIKLIATPVPHYKHGRGEGIEEIAMVGDGGINEYIHRADGTIEKTPAVETLTHLMPKDKVYSSKEAMMKALAMGNMQLSDYQVNIGGGIDKRDMERMTGRIEDAVSNIQITTQVITKEGWSKHNQRLAEYNAWVERVIKN